MGTQARVLVLGPPELVGGAVSRLRDLEQRWSRFLPGSEVTTVNTRAGEWVDISPETFQLFALATRAQDLTSGWFNPFLLHDLVASGYDRDFGSLSRTSQFREVARQDRGGDLGGSAAADVSARRRPRAAITLDPSRLRVQVSAGAGFDPGGIGKGLAADLVCAELLEGGAEGVLVNIGGDLRVSGSAPTGEGWVIGVPNPVVPGEEIGRFALADGAAATSSDATRRWLSGDEPRHHLLDPTTGRPARSGVRSVTVTAGSAWKAEVLATACFVAGRARGISLLEQSGVHGMVVDEDGCVTTTSGFDEVLF